MPQPSISASHVRQPESNRRSNQAYAGQVHLDVVDRRALHRLRRRLDNALDQHDALSGKARSPLNHGARDLVVFDLDKGLHGVGALAEVDEDHLSALGTERVHARAEDDGLPIEIRGECADVRARDARARLRLVEGKLAVELDGKVVLELALRAWAKYSSGLAAPERVESLTSSAACRSFSSASRRASFSACFFSFSACLARFFNSLLLGPFFSPSSWLAHEPQRSAPSPGRKSGEEGLTGRRSWWARPCG